MSLKLYQITVDDFKERKTVYTSQIGFEIAKHILFASHTRYKETQYVSPGDPSPEVNFKPWVAEGGIRYGNEETEFFDYRATIGYDATEGGVIDSITYTNPEGVEIEFPEHLDVIVKERIESRLNGLYGPEMYRQWCDDQFEAHQDFIESERTGN